MSVKKFDVEYYRQKGEATYLSHTCSESWEYQTIFCPGCGEKRVWAERGAGDYFVGVGYICVACGVKFYLPYGLGERLDKSDKQRLDKLRGQG